MTTDIIIEQDNSYQYKKLICDSLRDGKVICFPTETVYGIGCSADNYEAIKRIYTLKKRSQNKALSILVDKAERIKEICKVDTIAENLINNFTPGPLTLVLPLKKNDLLASNIASKDNYIGIRIPNHEYLRDIISFYNKPIIGTSCNISGEDSAINVEQISEEIRSKVDYIIDGGNVELAQASTVIKIIDNSIEILRDGYITKNDIIEVLSASHCHNIIWKE